MSGHYHKSGGEGYMAQEPTPLPIRAKIEFEDLSESAIRILTDQVIVEMRRRKRRNGSECAI